MPDRSSPIAVYHAGSLNAAMAELRHALLSAGGPPSETHGGPSVALANGIRAGELQADLFASADAQVIESVLFGAEHTPAARWLVIFCRQRMALVYSPRSRFRAELDAAAAGAVPWYEVAQRPGFVFKRGDPRNDPGGYRGVLACRLAELHYGIPGLGDRLLQGENSEDRIVVGGDFTPLIEGRADAHLTHATTAARLGLPMIMLPDEIDQGNPLLAAFYARVSYTNPLGQTFRGRPLAYGATIPTSAANPEGATAFLRFLLSEAGQSILATHGFEPAVPLVGGDAQALPPTVAALVQGRYDEAG
ncbi:MAG: extracellular solute-binding protein [Chloroflexi bacterium]|nr:extracellular solute-binding protein [Chloroflexota bacterium]